MIYKIRTILDAEDDVFRDIAIDPENTLEELHNAIHQAFGLEGDQMASFYISDDEWTQGDEIALFDMSEGQEEVRMMNETPIEDVLDKKNTRLIYVYDFMTMWTFYVELGDIAAREDGESYPLLLFSHGDLPDAPGETEFTGEDVPVQDPFALEEEEDEDWNNMTESLDDYDL